MKYGLILLAIAWTDGLLPGAAPDFARPLGPFGLRPASGVRALLVILWDPRQPEHPAPDKEVIRRVLFGPGPNVNDWFRENSGGRFVLTNAGVLGWFQAEQPADRYLLGAEAPPPGTEANRAWEVGQKKKWAEAIRQASQAFDFAAHDTNHDGRLSPNELGVLIVIPHQRPFGHSGRYVFGGVRPLLGEALTDHPPGQRGNAGAVSTATPAARGTVQVPPVVSVAEWYTGLPPNLGAAAHELAHLFLDLPDLYNDQTPGACAPGAFCLMDASFTTTHLNPFFKLKLGWLHYTLPERNGEYVLDDVETHRQVLILYDPARGAQEYFILENRWRGRSYDAGRERLGGGLPANGLAAWHIVEPARRFAPFHTPPGRRDDWAQRSIQLIRANGGQPLEDASALFDKPTMRISGQTQPARLTWSDHSAAPFTVEMRSLTGPAIRLKIELSTGSGAH